MAADPQLIARLEDAGDRFRYGPRMDRWSAAVAGLSGFPLAVGVLATAVALPVAIPLIVASGGIGAVGTYGWARFRNGGPAAHHARQLRDAAIDEAFANGDLMAAVEIHVAGRYLERGAAFEHFDAEFEKRLAAELEDPAIADVFRSVGLRTGSDLRVAYLIDRALRRAAQAPAPASAIDTTGVLNDNPGGSGVDLMTRRMAEYGVDEAVRGTLVEIFATTDVDAQLRLVQDLRSTLDRGGVGPIVEHAQAFVSEDWGSLHPGVAQHLALLVRDATRSADRTARAIGTLGETAPSVEPPGLGLRDAG